MTQHKIANYKILENYNELKQYYPDIAETLERKYNTSNPWTSNKIYLFPTYSDYGIFEHQSDLFLEYENIIIDKNFTGILTNKTINYKQIGRELVERRLGYDIAIQPKIKVIIYVTYPFKEQ